MTSATATMTEAARQYLLHVERELGDLPAEERADLLEDLAHHLAALEAERDEQPWAARLGEPSEYARELRAAAGLPERAAQRTGRQATVRSLGELVARSRTWRELRGFVPQLRPAWWVLRGYLLVLLPALWGVNGARDFPLPAPAGSRVLGAALVVVAVVASVAVGRIRLPRPLAAAVVATNVGLVVLGANLMHDAPDRLARVVVLEGRVTELATGASPLVSRHGPVTNVFPYASDGRPLSGVLLFDQDGRPLLAGVQQWWPDRCMRVMSPPLAADGVPVAHSYPQRYVLAPGPLDLRSYPVQGSRTCQAVLKPPTVQVPVLATTSPVRP